MDPNDRYLVISADCHGGGELLGYRPYLDRRLHDEFDAWFATYEMPYDDLAGPDGSRNWDSIRRLQELYPEIRVKLFDLRDVRSLLLKYDRPLDPLEG